MNKLCEFLHWNIDKSCVDGMCCLADQCAVTIQGSQVTRAPAWFACTVVDTLKLKLLYTYIQGNPNYVMFDSILPTTVLCMWVCVKGKQETGREKKSSQQFFSLCPRCDIRISLRVKISCRCFGDWLKTTSRLRCLICRMYGPPGRTPMTRVMCERVLLACLVI